MIKFEIDRKGEKQIVKGKYLYIDNVNNLLLIDNIIIDKLENISFIRFLAYGYYQTIHMPRLKPTMAEYDEYIMGVM